MILISDLYQNASILEPKYISGKLYWESGVCDEFKVTQFGQKMQQKLIFLFPFICYIYFMQKRTLGTKNALQRHYSERKTCFRPAAVLYSLLLDMLFVSSKDLDIKKWENAIRRTCWKHITYKNFKKFQKFEKKFNLSHRPFFLNVTRYIQSSTYVQQNELFFFW